MTNPGYTIVVLRKDNTIGHRIRTYDNYAAALGYLIRNLPLRPNLDMVSGASFVAWEAQPALVPASA